MSIPLNLFFNIKPPEVSGTHQVLSDATSTSAKNYDWVAALGSAAPKGSVMLTLEASTEDVWVRFKASGAAATTVTNGLLIKADVPGRTFYVDPVKHPIIDHIAAGTGTLQVQVSSPMGNRRELSDTGI